MPYNCFFCAAPFEFGDDHQYRGKHLSRYMIDVCYGCYNGNWDGWAAHWEAKLVPHLVARGLAIPARNSDGLLPRD